VEEGILLVGLVAQLVVQAEDLLLVVLALLVLLTKATLEVLLTQTHLAVVAVLVQ
jgi:hypothetical protein